MTAPVDVIEVLESVIAGRWWPLRQSHLLEALAAVAALIAERDEAVKRAAECDTLKVDRDSAAAAEREACAALCDGLPALLLKSPNSDINDRGTAKSIRATAETCADLIRARGVK